MESLAHEMIRCETELRGLLGPQPILRDLSEILSKNGGMRADNETLWFAMNALGKATQRAAELYGARMADITVAMQALSHLNFTAKILGDTADGCCHDARVVCKSFEIGTEIDPLTLDSYDSVDTLMANVFRAIADELERNKSNTSMDEIIALLRSFPLHTP